MHCYDVVTIRLLSTSCAVIEIKHALWASVNVLPAVANLLLPWLSSQRDHITRNWFKLKLRKFILMAVAGCCTVFTGCGTSYALPQVSQRAFNDVWVARLIMQITAMAWAVRIFQPWNGMLATHFASSGMGSVTTSQCVCATTWLQLPKKSWVFLQLVWLGYNWRCAWLVSHLACIGCVK